MTPRLWPRRSPTIVQTARRSIPGFDHVGISTVDGHAKFTTQALAGDLVEELDALQYELIEGPCVHAMTTSGARVVMAPRIRHEQRWPRYVPRAIELGLRSQLAIQLHLEHRGIIGGLNLYSTLSDDIDPEAEVIAGMFAVHAAIALGKATQVADLHAGLQTRKTIGQATGLLMERYTIDEDAAFAFMVRASSHGNIKLRDIAQGLVDDANSRGEN